jgi:hypothetical protein
VGEWERRHGAIPDGVTRVDPSSLGPRRTVGWARTAELARLEGGWRPGSAPGEWELPAIAGGLTRPASAAPRHGGEQGGNRPGSGRDPPATLAAPADDRMQPGPLLAQCGGADPERRRVDRAPVPAMARGGARLGEEARRRSQGKQHRHGDSGPGGVLMEPGHGACDGIAPGGRPEPTLGVRYRLGTLDIVPLLK